MTTQLVCCGDIENGAMVVFCECGKVRQENRPHAYFAMQIKGWFCPQCMVFNGEEKETMTKCRNALCEYKRPGSV